MIIFEKIIDDLNAVHWGQNSGYDILKSILVFLGLIILLKIIQIIVLKRLKIFSLKTKTDLDDVAVKILENISTWFYIVFSLFFASKFLQISSTVVSIIKVIFILFVIYQITKVTEAVVNYFIDKYTQKINQGENQKRQAKSMLKLLNVFIKIAFWIIGLIMILANMGVDVTSLIAGFGIGGIAVALAVQNILADLFSSFSIYLDKPFEIGDFIVIGQNSGVVERIGFKTTRIRTLQGEELVIANKELNEARIQNFKRMTTRRYEFSLGVVYNTAPEKLILIPKMVNNIIKQMENTQFIFCHFDEFATSSLNFKIAYTIDSPSYDDYMIVKEKINLEIFQQFAENKIEFAYPTQTVYVNKQ